jgi:hypothetical protein
MLTATHTHQGPGHFIENPAFSGLLSSRLPGFDPKLVRFFASRITNGIEEAYLAKTPAQLRWLSGSLWGVSRNRALEPFRRNLPPFASTSEPASTLKLSPSERAIDPRLDVLQINSLHEPPIPIGNVAFFAVHPTVLPAHTRMLGGDLFGVATRLVARELQPGNQAKAKPKGTKEARPPVAALVNTNEGDLAPAWKENTATEAIRLGTQLARAILELGRSSTAPWQREVVLDNRYLEVDLPGARYSGGRLCGRAVLGQSSHHGPPDHRSSMEGLQDEVADYAEQPNDDRVLDCQRPKAPLLGGLQSWLASKEGFAERVPLALQRLGDRWLAYVPAELTITAGQRLRHAIEAQSGPEARDRALVVGLANAYIEYVTTPEEYELQRYEGGSTLYGANTLGFLLERFAWLSAVLRGTTSVPGYVELGTAKAFEYTQGPVRDRLSGKQDGHSLESLSLMRHARFVCRVDVFDPPAICFEWQDGAPGRVALTRAPWVRLLHADGSAVPTCFEPLVFPTSQQGAHCEPWLPVDDRGFDFFTWTRGQSEDAFGWSTLYRPSKEQWPKLRSGQLQLVAGDIPSSKFTVDELKACEGALLRRCLRGALDR